MNPTPDEQPDLAPPNRTPPPAAELDVPQAAARWLGFGSFLVVFCAFLPGQLLQFLNLPFGLFATSLLVFGAAGLIFPAAFNLRPAAFTGLSTFPTRSVVLAVVIGAVNIPFANALMGAAKAAFPASWSDLADSTLKLLASASGTTRFLLVAAAAVAAPIGEELFFRGWLQKVFRSVWSEIRSAFFVAALFSAVHLDPVGFAARLELGLLFGLVRVWSGSLWPSIAMHATHNGLSTIALYFLTEDALKEASEPIDWRAAAIWGSISLSTTLFLLRRFPRETLGVKSDDRTPLVYTPRPAARLLTINVVLLVAVTAFLSVFRDRLPGANLTRPAPPASTPVTPAQGPNPKDGSRHLK